ELALVAGEVHAAVLVHVRPVHRRVLDLVVVRVAVLLEELLQRDLVVEVAAAQVRVLRVRPVTHVPDAVARLAGRPLDRDWAAVGPDDLHRAVRADGGVPDVLDLGLAVAGSVVRVRHPVAVRVVPEAVRLTARGQPADLAVAVVLRHPALVLRVPAHLPAAGAVAALQQQRRAGARVDGVAVAVDGRVVERLLHVLGRVGLPVLRPGLLRRDRLGSGLLRVVLGRRPALGRAGAVARPGVRVLGRAPGGRVGRRPVGLLGSASAGLLLRAVSAGLLLGRGAGRLLGHLTRRLLRGVTGGLLRLL